MVPAARRELADAHLDWSQPGSEGKQAQEPPAAAREGSEQGTTDVKHLRNAIFVEKISDKNAAQC